MAGGTAFMGIVYGVVNQKGGVGKTTTAVSLAAFMALADARVLLVDLDPQGNATSGFGIDRNATRFSTYDVLLDAKPVSSAMLQTQVANLMLLASSPDLAGAEIELMPKIAREGFLRNALEEVRSDFDAILIDAPPSLGLLTLNALVASDALIIPIQTEYYALEGISQLAKTIELVKRQLNPTLAIASVVMTMHDSRIRLANQVVAEVRSYFGDTVSPTLVPRNVRLSEAPSHGTPIAVYAPRSRGAFAYKQIAQEILKYGKEGPR
jgi:chromosome partitioning protein